MEIQNLLFDQIRERLPEHISLVDELSALLGISADSAYRRIRGEKQLSVSELFEISRHFDISIDALFSLKNDHVLFTNVPVGPGALDIKAWLRVILGNMRQIHEAKDKLILYSAKDPPLFHYFQFPEVAAFKTFFWQKTLLKFPEYRDEKFSLGNYDPEIQQLGEQCLAKYVKIPTIELWNDDTFMIAFNQMEYYWISGLFERKEDIYTLCDVFHKWLRHIQEQAELGYKFLYGTEPEGIEDSFKLYLNEVVLNDNSILVKIDDLTFTYLTYNVLSLAITSNPAFCQMKENFLRGLCQKSSLISQTNAKERSRFFNRLTSRIDEFRDTV